MVLGIVTLALFYQACNSLVTTSVTTSETSPVLKITAHYPVCRGSYSFHLMRAYSSTSMRHGTEQNAAVLFFVLL